MPSWGLALARAGQGFAAKVLEGAGSWGRGASGSAGSGLGLSACPAHAGLAGKESAANNSVKQANRNARKLRRLPERPFLLQPGEPLSKSRVLACWGFECAHSPGNGRPYSNRSEKTAPGEPL